MQAVIATLKVGVKYAEENFPSFTTIPGFLFWTFSIYIFSYIATLLCGPLIMMADNDLKKR